jgi:hypothetical protein
MRCGHRATWILTWSEAIDEGWSLTTTRRAYCSQHAHRQRDVLRDRDVSCSAEPVRRSAA